MECEKYLVMKCKYIIQINQHFFIVISSNIQKYCSSCPFFHSYNPKGVYTPDPPLYVLRFAFNHLETLL